MQRFSIGDAVQVVHDNEDPAWVGRVVLIDDVMSDGIPFDYYVIVPGSPITQACYDDWELAPVEDE
jgi:hypothetical protein